MIELHLYSTSNSHQAHIKVKTKQCMHKLIYIYVYGERPSKMKNSSVYVRRRLPCYFSSFVKNGAYRSTFGCHFFFLFVVFCVCSSKLFAVLFACRWERNSHSTRTHQLRALFSFIFTKQKLISFLFGSSCSTPCPFSCSVFSCTRRLGGSTLLSAQNASHNDINNVTSTQPTAQQTAFVFCFSVFLFGPLHLMFRWYFIFFVVRYVQQPAAVAMWMKRFQPFSRTQKTKYFIINSNVFFILYLVILFLWRWRKTYLVKIRFGVRCRVLFIHSVLLI